MTVSVMQKDDVLIEVRNDSKLHIVFTNHGAAIKDLYFDNKLITLRP